ncbi:MAG: Ig-like domain-containing protein, partial [Clostridia bacterium]|nr:Ig-like domain-containing protein [Clostridia bacterium]
PYHITGITLNKTRLTLAVGQTFQLTASLTPSTHPDDISVSTHWYTGNGDVVTVSDNGLVTAVGIGGTYIGADPYPTSTYELIFGQCNVEVVNKIPAESLEVALVDGSDGYLSGDLLTLEKGKTAHLKTTVTPSNSTDYIAFDNLNDGIIDIEGTPYITALNKGNSSTTVTVGNKSVTLRVRVLEKVPAVAATCTEAGNSVYWTDINGNKYSDKNGTSVTDPTIAALGHNFGDWEITKHPTETEEGEGKHTCTRCGFEETEIIPAKGADSYAFTADSVFTWEKGSKTGMPVTVKNTSGDDAATFGKFANVYVDGKKLTRNTDYTAEEGSIKVTLSAEYLQSLDTGTHIIKIELTVTSLEHEFTVTEPGSAPLTGDSIWTIVLFSALAVVSAAALIFVLVLRKKNHVK